jgi:mRNA interferase MazF
MSGSYRTYVPKRGDLVHMNFSPSSGHEMADRHYALVLSAHGYNRKSRMAIVCPITSHPRDWPYEVPVPAGLLPEKKGVGKVESVVLSDGVKQVDYREREVEFVAEGPKELVEEVLDQMLTAVEEE